MKLKDILPDHYINIQARTTDPFGDDMLFGYCHWTGTELVSDDGDNYSVEEDIVGYQFDDYGLAYWFKSKWWSEKDLTNEQDEFGVSDIRVFDGGDISEEEFEKILDKFNNISRE